MRMRGKEKEVKKKESTRGAMFQRKSVLMKMSDRKCYYLSHSGIRMRIYGLYHVTNEMDIWWDGAISKDALR